VLGSEFKRGIGAEEVRAIIERAKIIEALAL
jgi:hypothetical protein